MHVIDVGGVPITVEKKVIKNMYIRVLPPDGNVRITAPVSISDNTIRLFAASRIAWVKKQQSRFAGQPPQSTPQYVSGERHYLWGRRYLLCVDYSGARNEVSIDGEKIVLQVRRDSTAAQRAHVMDEWYRQILKDAIPPVLEKCERIVGVKADEWQVKDMRTRWGTCNIQKKRIWLNLQLAKKTPECLEYVVIHELVHLIEKNHNANFRANMDRFCPNWRIIKADLNGRDLGYIHWEE